MRKYYLHLLTFVVLLLALACTCGLPLKAVGLDEASLADATEVSQEGITDTNEVEGLVDGEQEAEELSEPDIVQDTEASLEESDDEASDEGREVTVLEETVTQDEVQAVDESQNQVVQETADTVQTQSTDEELYAQSTKADADAYAASHANDIVDGRYCITSMLDTSYSLDVKGGSTSNGASIILYTAKVADNQRWDIAHTSGGYVTIRSVYSGKYLQAGWDGDAWKLVQNKRKTSERGQLWIIAKDSDGSYKISSALNLKRAFHVGGAKAKNSANVIAYSKSNDEGDAHRRWNITVTTDILDAEAKAHKSDLANGTYLFTSGLDSSLAMAMKKASVANSALAVLGNKGPTVCQGWTISHTSNGYVIIVNAKSGKALDVKGGKAKSSASIIQWTNKKGSSRNQLWIASKASDGSITFTSALAGGTRYAMTVSASSPKNGTTIVLKVAGSTQANQRWTASKAPAQYAYAHDVADGTYAIATALNTKKVLDVSGGSTKDGAGVKLYTSKNSVNQFWELTHDAQGIVHLTNYNSKKELAFEDGSLIQSSSSAGWVFESASNGQYRIRKAGTSKYMDVKRSDVENKTNKIILYSKGSGKNQLWSLSAVNLAIDADTLIMGTATISQAQAVRCINKHFANNGQKLPEKWTKDGETVASLVKYFWEEGEAEGVRGDIALAQSIHETGWFQFGGLAKPAWYNFAGLGVTGEKNSDGSYKGEHFNNAREGIRAQIQHLKAYASTEPLKNKCVDSRFEMVTRGTAPTIRGLTGKWAVPGYSVQSDGSKIYYHDFIVSNLKSMQQS